MTHDDERSCRGGAKQGEICNECGAAEESKKILKRVCWLGDNAEEGDENCAAGNEEGAEGNPRREDVTEKEPSEKGVP